MNTTILKKGFFVLSITSFAILNHLSNFTPDEFIAYTSKNSARSIATVDATEAVTQEETAQDKVVTNEAVAQEETVACLQQVIQDKSKEFDLALTEKTKAIITALEKKLAEVAAIASEGSKKIAEITKKEEKKETKDNKSKNEDEKDIFYQRLFSSMVKNNYYERQQARTLPLGYDYYPYERHSYYSRYNEGRLLASNDTYPSYNGMGLYSNRTLYSEGNIFRMFENNTRKDFFVHNYNDSGSYTLMPALRSHHRSSDGGSVFHNF